MSGGYSGSLDVAVLVLVNGEELGQLRQNLSSLCSKAFAGVKWELGGGRFQVTLLVIGGDFGVCSVQVVVGHSVINGKLPFCIITCRPKMFVDNIGRCIMCDVGTI